MTGDVGRGPGPEPEGCEAIRLGLGAYVLDGLPADEAAAVEGHLAVCAACRAEAEELAELPPLLALVDDTEPDVPADLRERAVDLATRRPHARRRRRRTVALAAAAAALAGLLVGAGATHILIDRDPPPDEVLVVDRRAVDARVGLRDTPSGMDVELDAHVPRLEEGYYQVWLEWPGGHQVSAGTFVPDPNGRVDATLRTGGWREDYAALEIRAHDRERPEGQRLLRVALD